MTSSAGGPAPHRPPGHGYPAPPGSGAPPPGAGEPDRDPLVPPPGSGLGPWLERLTATLGRSWRTLGAVMLLTFALPQVAKEPVGAALDLVMGPSAGGIELLGENDIQRDTGPLMLVLALLLGLLLQLAVLFVNAVGWGAAVWAVTRQAAGQPAPVGGAMRAGLRRSGPMFGWYLLFSLMVAAGSLACVVPGIFLFVYGSMFSFVVVYERGRGGIGRSFGLVHRGARTAGRVLLLLLAFVAVTAAVGLLVGLLVGSAEWMTSIGLGAGGAPVVAGGSGFLTSLVRAAVAVPLLMLVLAGLLLTYTQLRAGEEPVSTDLLRAEADQR